ncbi:MAG TPA: hypothetical protein VML01_02945 [Bryobacterales bacterium]|nr:hypothetical protein [Bryobacterales bacterium]
MISGCVRSIADSLSKALLVAVFGASVAAPSQIIEFASNGLNYMTLSHAGLTLMYAPLPVTIRDFAVIQISYSNGTGEVQLIKPVDFVYTPDGGSPIRAAPEDVVIQDLYQKAGRPDVMKLQAFYEKALYGTQPMRSSNGYEARRLSALAGGPEGLRAAAAASAITLVRMEMKPGESTDGAVFFRNGGRPIKPGKLVVQLDKGRVFEFPVR